VCGEDGSKLVQRVNPNLWRTDRHCRTDCGITHPGWDLARYAGTNFEIQDILAAPSRSLTEAQPLAM
jgi:hypothetical protein